MPDELNNAVDSLAEHTRKLEIATHYTYGDAEKAKQMVAGTYKDIYAIKGKFSSTSLYGAYLIFFNVPHSMVNSIYIVLSNNYQVNEIKTNRGWRNFEKEITAQRNQGEHDDVFANQLRDEIMAGFTMQFSNDLKKLFESDDEIAVNRLFQKFIKDRMGLQNVQMTVDYEQITSVDMELYSTSSTKISAIEAQKRKEEEEKKKQARISIDDENPLADRDVKLLLQGNVILSPIKGKDIGSVTVGDRIRISITDRNPKAVQVAKAFNAYKDDGTLLPVSGRIVYIKHMAPNGYKIYAIVAKGIYIKIDEEEDNIKIALDQSNQVAEPEPGASSSRIILIVLLVIGTIVTISVLLALFL